MSFKTLVLGTIVIVVLIAGLGMALPAASTVIMSGLSAPTQSVNALGIHATSVAQGGQSGSSKNPVKKQAAVSYASIAKKSRVQEPKNALLLQTILVKVVLQSSGLSSSQSADSPNNMVMTSQDDLDKLFSPVQGKKFDQIFNSLSPEQAAEISRYSGGKSPLALASEFCANAKSDSFSSMLDSIRKNSPDPRDDPTSPVVLALLFMKMSSLCP
jgi:hypothetical protein